MFWFGRLHKSIQRKSVSRRAYRVPPRVIKEPLKLYKILISGTTTALLGFYYWKWCGYTLAEGDEKSVKYQNYIQMATETLEEVKRLASLTSWHFDYRVNKCVGFVKRLGTSEINCAKAIGKVATEPERMFETVWNFRLKEWRDYFLPQGNVMKWLIIQDINESTRIVYMLIQMDMGLGKKPREYIFLQSRFEEEEKKYIVFKSIDYPNTGIDSVRGNITVGGYIFSPFKDKETSGTELTHFLHMEPKGQTIPMVINSGLDYAFQAPRKIEKIMGIDPPPKEKWWDLFWKSRSAAQTL